MGGVEGFAVVARTLADTARGAGLAVPAFRSPPRLSGTVRTLRRYPGGAVVAVQLRDRPFEAVVADMVEGVVVANGLGGDAALRARTVLASSVSAVVAPTVAGAAEPSTGLPSDEARVVERQTRAA